MRNIWILLSFAAVEVLSGCALRWVSPDAYSMRGLGAPKCPPALSRSDCLDQLKRYNDEYDALQKQRSVSLKDGLKDDNPLCYKNPQTGEKPCAASETKEK